MPNRILRTAESLGLKSVHPMRCLRLVNSPALSELGDDLGVAA